MLGRVAAAHDHLPNVARHFECFAILYAAIRIRQPRDSASEAPETRFVIRDLRFVPARLVIEICTGVWRIATRISDQHATGYVLQSADPEF